MLSGKAQAATAPTAMGSLLQAATYGQTIPTIYGMTMSPLLAIWAANIRQGGSTKKFKQLKKGVTTYVENIDFLIGKNPIMGVQQMWNNGALIPLAFVWEDFATTTGFTTQVVISDPFFYAVIGVTVFLNYSVTFNDYGGTGPVTLSGVYEHPLWNASQMGPDPSSSNAYRNYPYIYSWDPGFGPIVDISGFGTYPAIPNPFNPMVRVYYTLLTAATSDMPPTAKMLLTFEPELGSGTEYAEADLSSQQIIYPMYAGLGSSEIDLGSGGAIPQLQAEIQGKFGLYATGDADFADMIEDIFKSGIAQASIGAVPPVDAYSRVEHGLSGYIYPGCVQKAIRQTYSGVGSPLLPFPMANTAGNCIIVFVVAFFSSTPASATLFDTLGNAYIKAGTGTNGTGQWTLFYCDHCKAGNNVLNFGNIGIDGTEYIAMELSGVDTFDSMSIVTGKNPTATVTTTNNSNYDAAMLAFSFQNINPSADAGVGYKNLWPLIISPENAHMYVVSCSIFAQQRNVKNPGTYSISWPPYSIPQDDNVLAVLAFKSTKPSSSPFPVGDFMDLDSLDQVRLQCRANGLYGSLSMNSQQSASDWLEMLYAAANAAPVFMGFKLFSFPYSEVSAVGNGATYKAPTASGPVANLSDLNGDFVGSDVPVNIKTAARVGQPNVLQMQCINRSSNYSPSLVSQPDAASISLFGVRKADPITNNAVQDVAIARKLLGIQVRNLQYGGDTYTFTLSARWTLLAPMDLVTVTDSLAGFFNIPVRISSIGENDDMSLSCQAIPFVYGMNAPSPFVTDQPDPFTPNPTFSAGSVNAPIIFEPVPQLISLQNQGQLWIVVSNGNDGYGGAHVFISTDGGTSYNVLGDPLVGSAVTGESTADWPAGADPDTTNNLSVDLTESDGVLQSYAVTDEDNFVYPCYVEGGGQPIPYELMAYAVATLTAPNQYTLMATGGGTNELRRGVFGAPVQGTGFDHPSGSRFAFLNPNGQGILKVNMQPSWIGVTLHFKICSFNTFGGSVQSLSDVTDYTYTPIGTSGSGTQIFQVNGA